MVLKRVNEELLKDVFFRFDIISGLQLLDLGACDMFLRVDKGQRVFDISCATHI